MMACFRRAGMVGVLVVMFLPLLAAGRAAAEGESRKVFMWKATKGDRTVYVLGSVHAGTKDMYPLPREVTEAFAASGALAVEADINGADPLKMAKFMQEKVMYPAGETLSGSLDKEAKADLEAFAKAHKIPMQLLDRMRPWLASMTLAAAAMQDAGLDVQLGVDKHFLDKAVKDKKPIVELESIDGQLEMLAGMDGAQQEAFLVMSLKDAGRYKKMFRDVVDAWKTGDAEAIDKLLKQEETPENKALLKKLIADRNAEMVKRIEEFTRKHETLFVVVGAAHLTGEEGVVKLLEKEGYATEQVTTKEPAATAPARREPVLNNR